VDAGHAIRTGAHPTNKLIPNHKKKTKKTVQRRQGSVWREHQRDDIAEVTAGILGVARPAGHRHQLPPAHVMFDLELTEAAHRRSHAGAGAFSDAIADSASVSIDGFREPDYSIRSDMVSVPGPSPKKPPTPESQKSGGAPDRRAQLRAGIDPIRN